MDEEIQAVLDRASDILGQLPVIHGNVSDDDIARIAELVSDCIEMQIEATRDLDDDADIKTVESALAADAGLRNFLDSLNPVDQMAVNIASVSVLFQSIKDEDFDIWDIARNSILLARSTQDLSTQERKTRRREQSILIRPGKRSRRRRRGRAKT